MHSLRSFPLFHFCSYWWLRSLPLVRFLHSYIWLPDILITIVSLIPIPLIFTWLHLHLPSTTSDLSLHNITPKKIPLLTCLASCNLFPLNHLKSTVWSGFLCWYLSDNLMHIIADILGQNSASRMKIFCLVILIAYAFLLIFSVYCQSL